MTKSAPPPDETALRARAERRLAVLREMAEIGESMARALRDHRLATPGTDVAAGRLAEVLAGIECEARLIEAQAARLAAPRPRRVAQAAGRVRAWGGAETGETGSDGVVGRRIH